MSTTHGITSGTVGRQIGDQARAWDLLCSSLLTAEEIDEAQDVIDRALRADLRDGPDLTSELLIPADAVATMAVVARQSGVLAGVAVAAAVFAQVVGAAVEISIRCRDGEQVTTGRTVLTVKGPHRRLLTAERVALNLLAHLSGVATQTARWVDAVADTGCVVRDTRKTTPGLHLLEKRAVRLGGGENHRLGLGDGILIKDNHVAAAGSIGAALNAVRLGAPGQPFEVEVDDLDQFDEALECGAPLVLLDNFTPDECVEAVWRRDNTGGRTLLEASGGLSLEVAGAYAATGVDYVAVGELTHSAPVLDLGLDTIPTPGGRS